MAITRMTPAQLDEQRDTQRQRREEMEARFSMSLTEWQTAMENVVDEDSDPLQQMINEQARNQSIWDDPEDF